MTDMSRAKQEKKHLVAVQRTRIAAVLMMAGTTLLAISATLHFSGQKTAVAPAATAAMVLLAAGVSASPRLQQKAFTVWVLAFVTAAMFYPKFFISCRGFELRKTIVPLVQVTLFGMGITLSFDDFTRVFKMPKAVLIGIVLQYTVMPIMGFSLARAFHLEHDVAAGLILVGSCPGGVASNVITYIAGANVALSVTMTACSTLISPIVTPLLMKLLAGRYVRIEVWPMMLSILQMVIAPLALGLLIHTYAERIAKRLAVFLPTVAMFSICVIIAITVSLSRNKLLQVGVALFGASLCHNAAGLLLGYCGAWVIGLDSRDRKTVAIEVGMQNGGMATGLAMKVFKSEIVAMASAVFGPWSAVSGSALASYWRRKSKPTFTT